MTNLEMVAIVLTITQAIKQFLRKWFEIQGVLSIILVVLVTACVVGYKFVTESLPFELASFLGMVAAVASEAIGGKLIASSLMKKVGT